MNLARKLAMTTGLRCLGLGAVFLVQYREFHAPMFDVLNRITAPQVWGAAFAAVGSAILACRRAPWKILSGCLIVSMTLTTMLTGTYIAERFSAERVFSTWLPVIVFSALVAKDWFVLTEGEPVP